MGKHVWKCKLAASLWIFLWVLLFLSCSQKVHCTIVWAFFYMLERYHWAFQKGISLRGWIYIKCVRMCYGILNYTVKLLVHHPLISPMLLKLPSHNKSHNMKALVILCHSSSTFLPLTCLYGKMNFCESLCGLLEYFRKKKLPRDRHSNTLYIGAHVEIQ